MQTARNIAVVALLALAVFALPGGGDAAETALTALTIGFLTAIGFLGYRLYREQSMTIQTLSDTRRGILYGALGLIGLLVVAVDEAFESGAGTLVWIALLAGAVAAIVKVWVDATTYS